MKKQIGARWIAEGVDSGSKDTTRKEQCGFGRERHGPSRGVIVRARPGASRGIQERFRAIRKRRTHLGSMCNEHGRGEGS